MTCCSGGIVIDAIVATGSIAFAVGFRLYNICKKKKNNNHENKQ